LIGWLCQKCSTLFLTSIIYRVTYAGVGGAVSDILDVLIPLCSAASTHNLSLKHAYSFIVIIHFPVGSQLEHTAPFRVPVITHTMRHTRTTQHINTRDKHPCAERDSNSRTSKQAAADLRLRLRGHWDRQICVLLFKFAKVLFLVEVKRKHVECPDD
jgi:hypothetical protein